MSVVVAAYTMARFRDLCRLFDSVEAQTIPGSMLILVIDQSVELANASKEYFKRKSYKNFGLQVLVNEGPRGVNACRNLGIRESRTDIVGVIDDDIVLAPTWVESNLRNYKSSKSIVAITGPTLPLWEDPISMSWFPKALYYVWGCTVWDWSRIREIRNVGGMNCSYRKEVVVKVGMYDVNLGPHGGEERIGWFSPSGEEVDLCMRIRSSDRSYRIVYDPQVVAQHKAEANRFNMAFVIKRSFRLGYSKHFVQLRFRAESHFMDMEEEHLKTIAAASLVEFIRGLQHPITASKRFVSTWLGASAAVLGYVLYSLKPYQPSANLTGRTDVTPKT